MIPFGASPRYKYLYVLLLLPAKRSSKPHGVRLLSVGMTGYQELSQTSFYSLYLGFLFHQQICQLNCPEPFELQRCTYCSLLGPTYSRLLTSYLVLSSWM